MDLSWEQGSKTNWIGSDEYGTKVLSEGCKLATYQCWAKGSRYAANVGPTAQQYLFL